METTQQAAGFYRSNHEIVYVTATGMVWLVQSDDLVGYGKTHMQIAEVPYQCSPVRVDDSELQDLAAALEAEEVEENVMVAK